MQENDIILSIVSVLLTISLIPQIIKSLKEKSVNISCMTILISCFGLLVISIVNFDIGLWFYAITNSFCAIGWMFLLFMKIKFEGIV